MFRIFSKKQKFRSNEEGAVLVLLALCIIVVAGIIGLAIDLNIGLSGSTDQQQLSNSLASAAMDAYLSTDSSLAQSDRLSATRQRVSEIFDRSQNKAIYQSALANPNEAASLCLNSGQSGSCSGTDQGSITPGYWHVVAPPGSDPCNGSYPCFVQGDGSAGDFTAFSVQLKQSDDSPIKTTFLRLFGIESMRTQATGTSAVVPRQIVLSVDLSSSVASTTHKLNGIAVSERRAAAYKLVNGITCRADHTVSSDPCTWPGSSVNSCKGILASAAEPFDYMWAKTLPAPDATHPRSDITKHFKSDYTCWHVNDDGNGPSNYLIDTFRNLNPGPNEVFYEGPQPLTSILNSINTALTVLERRRNAGDKIQLSFFDTTFFQFREIPYMQPSPQPFSLAPIKVGNADYDEIKALTEPLASDPTQREMQLAKRLTEHAIFPRINPLNTEAYRDEVTHVLGDAQDGGVFTNLVGAIRRSANALIRGGNVYARRNVALFSDFIPNCYENTDPLWCSNDWRTAQDGILSGLDLVGHLYAQNKIGFNPIMNGEYVRPHTTVPLDGNGHCIWDEDKIRLVVGPPLINGYFNPHGYVNAYGPYCPDGQPPSGGCDSFNADPPNTYYYYPNYFYSGALDTGGAWGVIRPCCKDANGNCGQDQRTPSGPLEQYCHNIDRDLSSSPNDPNYGCPTNASGHCQEGYAARYRWNDNSEIPGIEQMLDTQGRLICDPQGRTESQQMTDYMTKILGSNSIVLVPS